MASTSANIFRHQTQDQGLETCSSSQSAKCRPAFEELAPSSSTSVASKNFVRKVPYDVFINHRGPDVKEGLATNLYRTLNGTGLRVFLDKEELELGDSFPRELEEAIHSASVHIAIFSPNYAQSPWCLAELSLMIKTGTKIVPVFYHVQTDDVRHAKGVYMDAFSRHQKKGRYTPETLREWKDALKCVSYNFGHSINTEEDETKLLKIIVNYAVKEIKIVPLVVAKYPVGLDEAVRGFERLQSVEGHSTVQVMGIWGMGGVGKTTLAKQLYNNEYKKMERCSFLFDVRDAAHKSVLHTKQRKLLEDLGFKDEKVENVEEGKGILARHLRSVRVLIVLDDVDNLEQLDALVPEKDNLRHGSLIVVTTRQYEILKGWGISASSVYKMEGLNPSHAAELFYWHAFLQDFPNDGFAKLAKNFIDVCNGLPLSLKVLGGQLYGNSIQYWENQLEKILRTLPGDVVKSLKVSYDALDNEEKMAFLDAACFFIGEEKSLAIEVWNGSEGSGSGLCSWETLVNRCLVDVDELDCITMHDHLKDLGRNISLEQPPHRLYRTIDIENQREARRESPDLLSTFCPCFPSHIIMNFQKQEEKIIKARGIMASSTRLEWIPAATYERQYRYRLVAKPDGPDQEERKVLFNTSDGICTLSPSLGGLKFIVVGGKNLNLLTGEASREIVWIRWFPVGQKNLPPRLSLKNLRVLEIYETNSENDYFQELWKDGGDVPIQLRELVVSGCCNFQRFPESLGSLKYLKKIVVEKIEHFPEYEKVKSLPTNFCRLELLEHLKLHCQLPSLPDNFGDLRNLRYLYLTGCKNLKSLPRSFHKLTLLQYLHLSEFTELTLHPDLMKDMTKLEFFNLEDCTKVEELPRHITSQPSLSELHLITDSLRELPMNIGQLGKLRHLTVDSKMLTSLPTSLVNLSSLTGLKLVGCSNLEFLPDALEELSSLTSLVIYESEKLESLPDSVGRLCLLERLLIDGSGVKSLPKSVTDLASLRQLDISNCPISEFDLGSGQLTCRLHKLRRIKVENTQVSKISISEDSCPGLETLELTNNHHLEEIEILPPTVKDIALSYCERVRSISAIDDLVNIQKLSIVGCPRLDAIPNVAKFASLQEFELNGCGGVNEIQGLEHWTALEDLRDKRLRRLQLVAMNKSVIEPHIRTLEKWPSEEIVVCVRALPNAASLLNSAFRSLPAVASSYKKKIFLYHWCTLVPKWSPGADTIIVSFVVDCVTPTMLLNFRTSYFTITNAVLEKGKWVCLAILTQSSMRWSRKKYFIGCESGEGEVEMAMVGMGDFDRAADAFRQLRGLVTERDGVVGR